VSAAFVLVGIALIGLMFAGSYVSGTTWPAREYQPSWWWWVIPLFFLVVGGISWVGGGNVPRSNDSRCFMALAIIGGVLVLAGVTSFLGWMRRSDPEWNPPPPQMDGDGQIHPPEERQSPTR
jgi:hypothetical protein